MAAGTAKGTGGSAAPEGARAVFGREAEGHALADRLPELLLEAQRISTTVAHGIHGRRRAGTGETFWQFRQYQSSDPATSIDWRRSASTDHLYVREREWEAAHTVWLWPDLSKSMGFQSHLSSVTKRDRTLVLLFALGELLVRGGERIGLMGLSLPSASRKATTRMAETLVSNQHLPQVTDSLPPSARLARFSSAVLISDFLDPVAPLARRIETFAATGVQGTLIQVLDPAEETLPYDGRTEFLGLEGDERWVADRVETLRSAYMGRLAAHRAELDAAARRFGWSLLVHHTDRPATEPLLALIMKLQGNAAGAYRWTTPAADTPSTGTAGGHS
jgi:uncharacterized protein (DUF58 family)